MNTTSIEKEPIGAVVKKADHVFTQIVRKTSHGDFNRTEWQFLNFLHQKNNVARKDIVDFLAFFESKMKIQTIINRFETKNLVTINDEQATITNKGSEAFREAFQIQEKIKEKSLHGLTESDYTTAIGTLERIIENLTEFLPENKEFNTSTHSYDFDSQTEDLKQIKELVEQMEQAHNQKDPELLINLFAEDAVFVNAAGIRLQGREIIYKSAIRVMTSIMANSYTKYHISEIRFLKEDIAVVDINQQPTTITGELLPEETAGIPTYILMKDAAGKWKIVSGQNTLVIKNYS